MSVYCALFARQNVETILTLIWQLAIVIAVLGAWKMFEKAGEPGWAVIVPIYNVIVMGRIAGLSGIMVFLMFIPCVGIIPTIILNIKIAERFGKDAGFGVAAFFLPFICYPILGFSAAKYEIPLSTRQLLVKNNPPPDFSNLR